MYDQKENMNRNNNIQSNCKDLSSLLLKCSNNQFAPTEEKGPLINWKKQNFMEILKKQSVISRITQGEGFDERSLGQNISIEHNQEAFIKFAKLPSIEYIVQDYERNTIQKEFFRGKNMKLSDFFDHNQPFTSREQITEKEIDFSKHQKTNFVGQQRDKGENTWFVNHFDQIQLFHPHSQQKIEEFKINCNQVQFKKITHLQQENRKLQHLYEILLKSESLNDIMSKLQGSNLLVLKKIIQKIGTFQ